MIAGLRVRLTALVLVAALPVALSACGDDDSDTSVPTGPPPLSSLKEQPPRGASPLLQDIYRQFQPPEPDPKVKGSARVLRKGMRVCRGKTPREIRDQFIAESDLLPDQRRAVAELPKHERNPSPNFVAGQLAALVYEKTLPEDELATFGFQGCIYSLSLRLKRELAPKQVRNAAPDQGN